MVICKYWRGSRAGWRLGSQEGVPYQRPMRRCRRPGPQVRAIVPLPEPEWRMTAASHWRKWGEQEASPRATVSAQCRSRHLQKKKKKCQISHRKWRLKRAGDVAAFPRGSSRLGREISQLGCLLGKTIKKADTVWETEATFGVSRAQRFGGRNRRKWGQARLGPLPFALPWGS